MARPETAPVFDNHGKIIPFVGRHRDLQVLRDIAVLAQKERITQFVTLLGTKGAGKTRLLEEAKAALQKKSAIRVVSARGSQGDIAAQLVAGHFTHVTGEPAARVAAAERDWGTFDAITRALIIDALGGEEDDDALTILRELGGDYDRVRGRLLARFLGSAAKRYTWCAMIDDVDLADAAAHSFLEELALAVRNEAAMVVLTARPFFTATPSTYRERAQEHTSWQLSALTYDQGGELAAAALGLAAPQEAITEDVYDKCDGNPGFIMQLIGAYESIGVVRGNGQVDEMRLELAQLPLSVEDAVEARISGLEQRERSLLEKGAVFGNVFWASAVVSMSRMSEGASVPQKIGFSRKDDPIARAIYEDIDALVDKDYLLRLDVDDSAISGDVELVFKHNLERERIARSTNRDVSEQYHQWAAQWLETRPGAEEEKFESLAALHEEAGHTEAAGSFYLLAGDRAKETGQIGRALSFYNSAHDLLPESNAAKRFSLYHNRGDALERMGKIDEARESYNAMFRLAWQYDNRNKGGAAANRIARVARRRGDLHGARMWLERGRELFEKCGDRPGLAACDDDIGQLMLLGGDSEGALGRFRQGLSLRRELGNKQSIASSLVSIARAHRAGGRFRESVEHLVEAQRLQRDIGDRYGLVRSSCVLADMQMAAGDRQRAHLLLREAADIARFAGDRRGMVEANLRLGEEQLTEGRVGEAKSTAAECRSVAAEQQYRAGEVESHRLLAACLTGEGAHETAQRELTAARSLADESGYESLLLRATVTAATVYGNLQQGEQVAAWLENAIVVAERANDEFERLRYLAVAESLWRQLGRASDADLAARTAQPLRYGLEMALKQRTW